MTSTNATEGDARRPGTPKPAMIDRATPRKTMRPAATPAAAMVATPDLATSKMASLDAVISNPPFVRYPGGKNGAGVFHKLINMMPPHRTYIEPFLGSGAILRRKKFAARNVGIDVDAELIARYADFAGRADCSIVAGDALTWLRRHRWEEQTLVYCDPPYLGSARMRPGRACYRHEMLGADGHRELLRILTSAPAMIMISGYASPLYDGTLAGWRRVEFQAMTRGGLATEVVWMNFPEPSELHDYRFLGTDFHDRCRIARKINRWVARLEAMPVLERAAVLSSIAGKGGAI